MKYDKLSIIIPTLNEEGNVGELVRRIDRVMRINKIIYEIIFIDDHSTDRTEESIKRLLGHYPVYFFAKKGEKGKAQSLLEGFDHATYDYVAILDADLQYPPEALPEMLSKFDKGFDIIVADRARQSVGPLRKILNRGFSLFFTKILHNLDCDVQSGMKVFRKEIIEEISLNPTPWTFDLEFLIKARSYGYSIGSVPISFTERRSGKSKIVFLKAIYEIGINAIDLKFKRIEPLSTPPKKEFSMLGAGVAWGRKRFITHTTLEPDVSAIEPLISWQEDAILIALTVLLVGFIFNSLALGIALVSILSIVYFLDALFSAYLILKSLKKPPEISFAPGEILSLEGKSLPVYSILCPLYKEGHMLSGFVSAIGKIDWPKDKLDVLLLLEENDKETIAAAEAMNLPPYIRILTVPDSLPKTKPKACNYGLCFASGEYVVIYDAEDIPDPLQLKKAFLAFNKLPENIWCLQAKLNYFNPSQNLLTRLFTAEYSLWFDVVLPGLQTINTFIPLGGTSNHFRTKNLRMLRGWDPFNVTEDCDLGIRIFKEGYGTAIIDSVTNEEANSNFKNWLRQRSRWIKGYIQTYFVHMRHPVDLVRRTGVNAFVFQLIAGGKTIFLLVNPFLWLATFSYFAFNSSVGPAIEKLYSAPAVFYIAVASFIFGNFLYFYSYMIGCAKRGQWGLIKYTFLMPFYWLMMSAASVIAIYQIFTKPHYWEKTQHGLFPGKVPVRKEIPVQKRVAAPAPAVILEPSLPQKNEAAVPARNFMSGAIFRFLFSEKGFLVLAAMLSNFFNFIFNAFLGRVLDFEALGLVAFVSTFWYVIMFFFSAFGSTVNHKTAYLSAAESKSSSASFLRSAKSSGWGIVLPLSIIWLIAVPFLSGFFKIEDYMVLSLFAPAFIFAFISSANGGFLNGNLHFASVAKILLVESSSKLVLAGLFFYLEMTGWIYASVLASVIISSIVSIIILRGKTVKAEEKEKFIFPKKFFTASLLTSISSALFLSMDIMLVKHFLPPLLAGEYVLLSLVGKMVYFLGFLPNMFMLPYVSRSIGLRKNPENAFRKIYMATFALSLLGVFVFGFMGGKTIPFLFGDKALKILPFVSVYAIAIALFTITNTIVIYHLARKNYYFAVISLLFSAIMGIGISVSHGSIRNIVEVVYSVSVAGWVVMEILDYLEKRADSLKRNFTDFIDIFQNQNTIDGMSVAGAKKILIFNWRDMRHKFAGGAEVYVHEIAKNWVSEGHQVTIFCGSDNNSSQNDRVDGVEIVRRGGFYFVYLWAFLYYIFRFRGRYDVVIDCQNGIPFFTPFYAKEPVYCLMHHVHQEVFRRSLSRPLALIARVLEKNLMPVAYKKTPFITVSKSSKKAITNLGLGKAGVSVVYPGVHLESLVPGRKASDPVVLYLGRLKAYKSIDVLIRAFCEVLRSEPRAVLIIAGSGDEEGNLKKLAETLHMGGKIKFTGKISEEEKIALLQKAWVLANPSFMEGWGIVTIEANACGTPVVAADVPGLRDSVKKDQTGYLVEHGDVKSLSEHILKIIKDKELRKKMSSEARLWAEHFDWKTSSGFFLKIIESRLYKKISDKFVFSKNDNL